MTLLRDIFGWINTISSRLNERKYSNLWQTIFRNPRWLNAAASHGVRPILVGKDLHRVRHGKAHVLLIAYDTHGDLKYDCLVNDSLHDG